VDGTVLAAGMSFPVTGGWRAWTTLRRTLVLGAGRYTVRLTSIGRNGPNLDALVVRPGT
jgi:hypothetical protein